MLGLSGLAVMAAQEGRPSFRAAVQLVEVYVTVAGAQGAMLGLGPEDFELFEDEQPQTIESFASGDVPLAVILGIDRSFSMAGAPLDMAKRASRTFLRALHPDDRSSIIAISSDADLILPFSTDRAAQLGGVDALEAWGTTALYDSVLVALDRLESEAGRRALVVFSDGVDRGSRATAVEVIARVRRGGTLLYPVVLGPAPSALAVELAVASGGRSWHLADARELEAALGMIVDELRSQYFLGYVPAERVGESGAWHSIQVRLRSPRSGVRVRARSGYFSG